MVVAFYNQQNTFTPTNLIFSFICLILLNAGFQLGYVLNLNYKNYNKNFNLNNNILLVAAGLTILSCYYFYINQTSLIHYASNSRDFVDENINPVGIAYSNSLLFLFFFWAASFTSKMYVKIIMCLTMIATMLIIISSMSRGALIFISILFFIYIFREVKLSIRALRLILKVFFISLLLIAGVYFYSQYNSYLESRLNGTINRFSLLIDFTAGSYDDQSINAREEYYEDFYGNYHNWFLGERNYKPYPHNQFLEMYMRWGIFGIPIMLFSIYCFLKSLQKLNKNYLKNKPILFLILILFFISYLQSMSSLSLEMNRSLWLGFGFIYGYYR